MLNTRGWDVLIGNLDSSAEACDANSQQCVAV